jgi:hypothetical protein
MADDAGLKRTCHDEQRLDEVVALLALAYGA